MSVRVALIGGPARFNGQHVTLTRTPPRIEIDGVLYTRIDDPDTGEPLGGYWAPIPPMLVGRL